MTGIILLGFFAWCMENPAVVIGLVILFIAISISLSWLRYSDRKAEEEERARLAAMRIAEKEREKERRQAEREQERLRQEAERNRLLAEKEQEKARRIAEREEANALREAEKVRLRAEKAQAKSQQQAEKKLQKIHDGLHNSTTIRQFMKAMNYAQAELSNIDVQFLCGDYLKMYSEANTLLAQRKSTLYNQRIKTDFDAVCTAAIAKMKPLEHFASDMNSLFRQIDSVHNELPIETQEYVLRLKQEVGID